MKKLSIILGCLLLMAGLTFGQSTTQSINLYTSGSTTQTSTTLNAGDSFSIDTYISFTGFTAVGLSYWLEAQSALAPHLTLNSEMYFTFSMQSQPGTNNGFANMNSVDSGFKRETRDLGSTSIFDPDTMMFTEAAPPPGPYLVSTLHFTIDGSIAPGTYIVQLTTKGDVPSEISSQDSGNTFTDHDVMVATYTITVVPEPATLSLLGLGALGSFGLTALRARRKA